MDNISIHVKGVSTVEKYLEAQVKRLDAAAQRIVEKGGLIIANNAKGQFKGGGTADENHPNPTFRTGNLRNSIKVLEVRREGLGMYSSKTGPTMMYGRRVELGFSGTVNGYTASRGGTTYTVGSYSATTRAFPYMAPGFEKSRAELQELYSYEWRKALS